MAEIPKMSLWALRLSQQKRVQARDELEMAMRGYWNELSGVQPTDRTRVGHQHLIQLLGAYASKIFEIGAGELVDWKLEPIDIGKRLEELAPVVQAQLIPPQFDFHSGFCLSELEYDEAYRSHINGVLEDCVRSWKKKSRVAGTEEAGHPSPHEIIERYCKQKKCTIQQLAAKARVDESVIYAVKAGRQKCSAAARAKIAEIVGCEASELAPKA